MLDRVVTVRAPLRGGVAAAVVAVLLATSPAPVAAEPSRVVPTTVTAQVSSTAVKVGTAVSVTGTVLPPDPVTPRTVVLQVQTASGWRELGRTSSSPSGGYSFAAPTDWYGAHVLRVVAPATATFDEGVSPVQQVRVKPAYKPRGKASAWKRLSPPARWDPCATIGYRTNLRRAPNKGSLKLVKRAFATLHAATGLRFRHLGRTTKVPFSGGPDARQFTSSGLVVAWTTPKVVKALAGGTAGIGGATSKSVNGGPWRYVYGGVSLDATQKLPGTRFGPGASPGTLLLHELAHAMGLDHVRARSQVMYPSLQRGHRGRFEAGDLAGLRAVGAAQGCL